MTCRMVWSVKPSDQFVPVREFPGTGCCMAEAQAADHPGAGAAAGPAAALAIGPGLTTAASAATAVAAAAAAAAVRRDFTVILLLLMVVVVRSGRERPGVRGEEGPHLTGDDGDGLGLATRVGPAGVAAGAVIQAGELDAPGVRQRLLQRIAGRHEEREPLAPAHQQDVGGDGTEGADGAGRLGDERAFVVDGRRQLPHRDVVRGGLTVLALH